VKQCIDHVVAAARQCRLGQQRQWISAAAARPAARVACLPVSAARCAGPAARPTTLQVRREPQPGNGFPRRCPRALRLLPPRDHPPGQDTGGDTRFSSGSP